MSLRKLKNLKTVDDLKEFIRESFRGKPVNVYLFGSRARGNNSPYSDVDIAVDSEVDIRRDSVILGELLEESSLPYLVDLKGALYLRKP